MLGFGLFSMSKFTPFLIDYMLVYIQMKIQLGLEAISINFLNFIPIIILDINCISQNVYWALIIYD